MRGGGEIAFHPSLHSSGQSKLLLSFSLNATPVSSSLAGKVVVIYSMILRRWIKGQRSWESCSELVRRTMWCVAE